MKRRILVVDDNKDFLKSVSDYLKRRDFQVYSCFDPSLGISMCVELLPDLVICDVNLPEIDGIKFFSIIKNTESTRKIPFILISGDAVDENFQLKGYEQGVEDYIIKPFSFKILEAKINRVLSHYSDNPRNQDEVIERAPFKIDFSRKEIYLNEKPLDLTKKEYQIMELLLKNPGRVFSPSYFLEKIWGYDLSLYNDKHTVEVHFSNIRRKIGKEGSEKIKNLIGFGYKYEG